MNDNEGKAKERDIQKRAFSFACRIVKLYQFLAKQKSVGEVKRIDQRVKRTGSNPYDYRKKVSSF